MTEQSEIPDLVQRGLNLPPEQKLYFNGFTISMTPHDFLIILQRNNETVLTLNTSHTIAKTLGIMIEGIVDGFERKTDQSILTLNEVNQRIEDAESRRSE
jgi:hypothetical protein